MNPLPSPPPPPSPPQLDFKNEAVNQTAMKELLAPNPDLYVPFVYPDLCTRRVLVSEWVIGMVKETVAPFPFSP